MNAAGMGVGVVFSAVDHASGVLTTLSSRFQGLAAASGAARAAVQRNVKMIGIGLAGMVGGMKLVGGAFHAAAAFGDFEQGIASIAGITRATMAQMEELKKAAITAAVETQFSPKDAVDALQTLAAAGQTATQSMTTLIPALNLAAGSLGQLTVAESAQAIVGTLNSYQISADQAVGVTDKLLRITQLTNFQARDFAVGLSVAAGKAAGFKQNLTDVLVGMGLLRNANIDASVSQTALTAAFMRIGGEPRVTKIIEGLGIKVFDAAGKIRPALDVMGELAEKTRGMTDRQRLEIWSSVFERRGILAMNAVANAQITTTKANIYAITAESGAILRGEQAYARLRERIVRQGGSLTDHTGRVYRDADAVAFLNDAMDKANQITVKGMEAINAYRVALEDSSGTAEEYKRKLLDTYKGQVTLLEGAVQSFQVVFGEGFAAALRPGVSALYDLVGNKLVPLWRDMSVAFKKAIGITVALGGALLAVTGIMLVLRGVTMLLGFSFKGLLLAMGGVLKMALPIMAIGFLIYNLFVGMRRSFGEGADAVNSSGERVYGFFKRLELILRAVTELIFTGGLGEALTAELNKGQRSLRILVNEISMWIAQAKEFFIQAAKGIQDGGAVIIEVLKEISDAFGDSKNTLTYRDNTNQAAKAMRDAAESGRKFGQVIVYLGVLWASTKIIWLVMTLWKALVKLYLVFRLIGAWAGVGATFGAFATGLGIVLAIVAAVALLIYYWDEVTSALEDFGGWMGRIETQFWNWIKGTMYPVLVLFARAIRDVFLDIVDAINIVLLRIEIAFRRVLQGIGIAIRQLPEIMGGDYGAALAKGQAEAIARLKERIRLLNLPQDAQRIITHNQMEDERSFNSPMRAEVASNAYVITPERDRDKTGEVSRSADFIERVLNAALTKTGILAAVTSPKQIQLIVDGEVLATAVERADTARIHRSFEMEPSR